MRMRFGKTEKRPVVVKDLKVGDVVYVLSKTRRSFFPDRHLAIVMAPRGWTKKRAYDRLFRDRPDLDSLLRGQWRHSLNRGGLLEEKKGSRGVALAVLDRYSREWLPVVVDPSLIEGRVRDIRPKLIAAERAAEAIDKRLEAAKEALRSRGLLMERYGFELELEAAEQVVRVLQAAEHVDDALDEIRRETYGADRPVWAALDALRKALEAGKPLVEAEKARQAKEAAENEEDNQPQEQQS